MWRRGGYGKDFKHRLGMLPKLKPCEAGKKRVWLQAVSVGEVMAIEPLIESLQRNNTVDVVLTTTTSTGYAAARKKYSQVVTQIGIFPLDFWPCSKLAWSRIQPHAVVLTESELWPEHLYQARKHTVPAILINARMSDRSYNRYLKFTGLAKRLFSQLDHIYTSSERDQKRILELGGDSVRVTCAGNIKFDAANPEILNPSARAELRSELGFDAENTFVLLGSSTWSGEETALIEAQSAVRSLGLDCRLLIVPRHAERAPEIVQLLETQNLPWHQRSVTPQAPAGTLIYLADTTGELSRLAQVADLAFIGKSIAPNEGGQNPIEAAALGLPIVMGSRMSNFREVAVNLLHANAALEVNDSSALIETIVQLAKDPNKRSKMGTEGRAWHARNTGSTERITEGIRIDLR